MNETWLLEVRTPFGTHPATLKLSREGANTGGVVESKLGPIPLQDLTLDAESFSGNAFYTFQGRQFEARVAARFAGDRMEGTIKVNFPLAPTVHFTGTRAA